MESEGIAAVHVFVDAFNRQDHEAHARALNYPHVRLANGRFLNVDSKEQFREISVKGEVRLAEEGWHHCIDGSQLANPHDSSLTALSRSDRLLIFPDAILGRGSDSNLK